jgi:polyphosphate glucokinase
VPGINSRSVLVLDVGGTHVKVLSVGRPDPIKIPSGSKMTPRAMVDAVREATTKWNYRVISIGYPGVVTDGQPTEEPQHLGHGWVGFDFEKALSHPVRIINDAALQALGAHSGGRMLFLGLGTGLGSAMVVNGTVIPMELGHLPYRRGRSYEDYVGEAWLQKHGKRKWRKHVDDVVALFRAALEPEDVVIGGGNARLLGPLPPNTRIASEEAAVKGGVRLWEGDGS